MIPILLATLLAQDNPVRLLSEADHLRLLASLPRFDNPEMEKLKADPNLILFDDRTMPSVFQAANNGQLGVFKAGTFFTVGDRIIGHGKYTFPWKGPAGLDEATGWSSFGFMLLPQGTAIQVHRERLPADVQSARFFSWTFPTGTVLGEVFQMTGDPSRPVFEVRVRRKIGPNNWRPDVFRPYQDRDELDQAVAFSGSPHTESFLSQRRQVEWQFKTDPIGSPLLRNSSVKDFLPPLDRETVKKLLQVEFTSAREREWVKGGLAPDTNSDFHIVPRGYNGSMIPVTTATCASCHRTAGQNVRSFQFVSPVGWDEWVPGNAADESFRAHPFDSSSVSTNRNFLAVRFNRKLVSAGLIQEGGPLR